MFNRILKLFPKFGNTPLENFTTEVLVAILKNDKTLLDKFVNTILKITGSNFDIESQVYHSGKYIDIEIKNEATLIFIENKVNSPENDEQLKSYRKILDKHKDGRLILCTRYIEGSYNLTNFQQIRWLAVYDFLKVNNENDSIINNFLNFMIMNNLGSEVKFKPEDLVQLSNTKEILVKFNEYKIIFKKAFIKEISKNINEPDVFKRILGYGDLIVQKDYKNGLWVGAGLSFNDEPRLTVWIWIHKTKIDNEIIMALLRNEFGENKPTIKIHEKGLEIFSLLSDDEQNIEGWYTINLKKIKNFIVKTNNELNWQD